MDSAFVQKDGQERNVTRSYVIQDARTMVSAEMVHACAFRVGMENTAHWVSKPLLLIFLNDNYKAKNSLKKVKL